MTHKITDTIKRFDRPVCASIEALDTFHMSRQSPAERDGTSVMSALDNSQNDTPVEMLPEKTYADGLAEGQQQQLADTEAHRAYLREAVDSITHVVTEACQHIETSHGRVVTQVLQTVLPSLAKNQSMSELQHFIMRLTAPAMQGCVTIHVPAHADNPTYQDLEGIINAAKTASSGKTPDFKLEISAKSDAPTSTKIRATWQDGGGIFDIENTAQQCIALLNSSLENTATECG